MQTNEKTFRRRLLESIRFECPLTEKRSSNSFFKSLNEVILLAELRVLSFCICCLFWLFICSSCSFIWFLKWLSSFLNCVYLSVDSVWKLLFTVCSFSAFKWQENNYFYIKLFCFTRKNGWRISLLYFGFVLDFFRDSQIFSLGQKILLISRSFCHMNQKFYIKICYFKES